MRGPNYWSISHHKLIVADTKMQGSEIHMTRNPAEFIQNISSKLTQIFSPAPNSKLAADIITQYHGTELLGYLLALIALHLQRQAGIDCSFITTTPTNNSKITQVVFEYKDEKTGLLALKTAVKIVESLLKNENYDIAEDLLLIEKRWDRIRLNQLTGYIVDEAMKRNIPCIQSETVNDKPLIQFGYGANQRRILNSVTDRTTSLGVRIAGNKELTKSLLRSLGVPVPAGKLIYIKEELDEALESIGYPVVLKPLGSNHGKGVTVNITDHERAAAAFEMAHKVAGWRQIIVEKFVRGMDYRLLVIGHQLVAAARRTPAMVTGDGISTIKELIDIVNSDPRRGTNHKPLTVITADEVTLGILKRKGLTLDSILPSGQQLFLKGIANLSAGGTSTDVTESVHPDNAFMAERISRIVGLDICGLDVISPDIGVPFNLNQGAVIEVNSNPGFRSHMTPTEGKPRNAAGYVMDMLFPGNSPSRIPIIAITGPPEKTFASDLMAAMMGKIGFTVGCATSAGIHIHHVRISQNDTACVDSYKQAELILRDPTVDFAILECQAANILATGVAFHNCDVAVVIDPEPEEGQTARALPVVPACVLPSGYAILNADNDAVYQLHKDLACNIACFSASQDNPHVTAHISHGGYAAIIEDQHIAVYKDSVKTSMMNINDIPEAGRNDPSMMKCVLASMLAGTLYNVPVDTIRQLIAAQPARYYL